MPWITAIYGCVWLRSQNTSAVIQPSRAIHNSTPSRGRVELQVGTPTRIVSPHTAIPLRRLRSRKASKHLRLRDGESCYSVTPQNRRSVSYSLVSSPGDSRKRCIEREFYGKALTDVSAKYDSPYLHPEWSPCVHQGYHWSTPQNKCLSAEITPETKRSYVLFAQ